MFIEHHDEMRPKGIQLMHLSGTSLVVLGVPLAPLQIAEPIFDEAYQEVNGVSREFERVYLRFAFHMVPFSYEANPMSAPRYGEKDMGCQGRGALVRPKAVTLDTHGKMPVTRGRQKTTDYIIQEATDVAMA